VKESVSQFETVYIYICIEMNEPKTSQASQASQAAQASQTYRYKVGNSKVTVGRFSYGYNNIAIKQWGEGASLRIGQFCSIAKDVNIFLGGNHRTDWISTFPFGHIFKAELGGVGISGHPSTKGDVVIGDDVWIAYGVTILSGITIGTGAVIAANSHVVKSVSPYEIVGGNPAKHIKYRFDSETQGLLLQLKWWDLPITCIRRMTHDLCAAPSTSVLKKLIATYRGRRALGLDCAAFGLMDKSTSFYRTWIRLLIDYFTSYDGCFPGSKHFRPDEVIERTRSFKEVFFLVDGSYSFVAGCTTTSSQTGLRDHTCIYGVCVHKDKRKMGACGALVTSIAKLYSERASLLEINCDTNNRGAYSCYDKIFAKRDVPKQHTQRTRFTEIKKDAISGVVSPRFF
jgi:acetyltransferase-like isoleucine patch superfamily enzyme